MEENKRIEEAPESSADQAEPVDQTEAVDQAEPIDQAEAVDQTDGADRTEGERAEAPQTDWRFGAEPAPAEKKRKGGHGGFFAIFGSVFGVCVLLLIGVLCLGDGSFQIIRNLKTERVVYVREDDGTSGLLTPHEAADKIGASTVSITVRTETGSGVGSGFIYTADGYVLTNRHVIDGATAVQVVLPDGTAYDAQVIGSDAIGDVAVLKISATGLTPAEIGSSADLLVGDDVVAVGTPANLNYAGTATFGSVSATARLVPITNSTTGAVEKKMTLIQTDTSVNPGNSGGPLADMYGKVVGMVVMKITVHGGVSFEGIGFALPIDGVKTIADEIIKSGSFKGVNPIAEGRSLLGVTGHGGQKGLWYSDIADAETGAMDVSETEKAGYHLMRESGVYVMEINGNNASGKLQRGDIIMKVDGQNVYATTDLIDIVNRRYAGENVTLTVLRGEEQITVEITLYEERAS